ncbi:hypothetical protein N0V83_003907 [Neocucurbitaria cava]|uniref:Exonuclease domain-containing protein n=1 Tax=Neocucurbitaria cava TaxID=798079 RepID=A0A9W8YBT9_9PLEO|nr:hypothetical protein N0V83_003907 [Neocucurbitaria cava]
MAKRKRGDINEQTVDVGLGATLAHLRDEEQADGALPTAVGDDDQGWTIVGGPKRRRQERDPEHNHRHRSPDSSSSHRHNHLPSVRTHSPPPQHRSLSPTNVPLDNPFSSKDEKLDGHYSNPENPFATHTSGIGRSSGEVQMDREERKKARKLDRNYPTIEHSFHARLQSHVKITDLQSLALYLLADGNAPQWVAVRNRTSIQQVVVLMVPGLELGMFNGEIPLDSSHGDKPLSGPTETTSTAGDNEKPTLLRVSHDEFYPASLRPDRLPTSLKPLSDIFAHVWPIKAQGEHRANQYIKVHSPIHTMLTSQIPKSQEEKQMKKSGIHKGPVPQDSKHWENKRTPITQYIASLTEQQENEYVLHPAMFITPEAKEAALRKRISALQTVDDGWVDTNVANLEDGNVPENEFEQGSVTTGRHVISVDCEMCKAEDDQLVLTRISLLNWDGSVALDKLVKPGVTIKDYLTQWSGITATMLEDVTATLEDIQKELLEIITPRTILIGHSLNSDLNALKLTHPFIIDTGILYPHPRGPPYKQSLKWLAQKYLKREVQKGTQGHNSVEDARTCLDLVKQKCEKGPRWGSSDTNAESLFKRLGRTTRPKSNNKARVGAVIDWGDPNRGHGSQAQISIGCQTDAEVVDAISRAMKGQAVGRDGVVEKADFVWARLRELELSRGWWDDAKTADVEAIRQNALQTLGLGTIGDDEDVEVKDTELGDAVSRNVSHIKQIYDSLPRCTAYIVYSGTGDPRQIRRLQAMQQQYRREYATKNWDNLSVKWTDTEVQALSTACQDARNGIGFIAVK